MAENVVILKRAQALHEDLRNYAQLGETEKPLVVSAILLALNENERKMEMFINSLTGDAIDTDGQKIFNAVSVRMDKVKVPPRVKKEKILNQFNIIKDRTALNEKHSRLGQTPLRYYTEYLQKYVMDYAKGSSSEDVLGKFYGEFMSYSGGDGQSLGVVLTPKHITELFCDLVDIKPEDILFDPCCGTGSFLIAGMCRMLELAKDKAQKNSIRKNQVYGIEFREDMFSIATTNMILRGDGKSNVEQNDFLKTSTAELKQKGFTVGFMNPPYSQAKTRATQHLAEINFIEHLLDSMSANSRVAVIVPQSTMVGKTKETRAVKKSILEKHTLKGVITLNKQTFYRIGTSPCIAIFTAGIPHQKEKLVKFINYEDDGYVVNKNIGLVRTERAQIQHQKLMDVWRNDRDAEIKFMVKVQIKVDDEWLHSFYCFNDEIPTDADFERTMADYLTFEFNMISHNRGYLFGMEEKNE